jgi:hypothetical protein
MVKINEYFEKNYKKELSKYKQFCYLKYKDIDSNEVMDMFNDCYIKLINSKSAQNGTIQDVAKQISYSQATVYKQNGIMFKKIRQELYDNPDLYYN